MNLGYSSPRIIREAIERIFNNDVVDVDGDTVILQPKFAEKIYWQKEFIESCLKYKGGD
jgi:hypothetical protein